MKIIKKPLFKLFVHARAVFLHLASMSGCRPTVLNREDSLLYILHNRISISRYGDGELLLMEGDAIGFQDVCPELAERLRQITRRPVPNHHVCIPGVFHSLSSLVTPSRKFWKRFLFRKNGLSLCNKYFQSGPYLDALISRFYINLKDKSLATRYIDLWRQIFAHRNLLIVEGPGTRLGLNNDLFQNASSIKRILGPAENAFDHYQEILETTLRHASDHLVLIALGPTATVLAYDLAQQGIQALDIGHIDIEYAWYNMGAQEKVAVPDRYVNETHSRVMEEVHDPEYLSQIIARIGISSHLSA